MSPRHRNCQPPHPLNATVPLLISSGVLTPEAARTHARRNVVTNVIGGPSAKVHAEIHKVRLEDGDVLLLCSDGLTESVRDESIAQALAEAVDPNATAERLVALALENGGPDNVTAVVARYTIADPDEALNSTGSYS